MPGTPQWRKQWAATRAARRIWDRNVYLFANSRHPMSRQDMIAIIKEECRTVQLFEENKLLMKAHREIRNGKLDSDPWQAVEQLRQISKDVLKIVLNESGTRRRQRYHE